MAQVTSLDSFLGESPAAAADLRPDARGFDISLRPFTAALGAEA